MRTCCFKYYLLLSPNWLTQGKFWLAIKFNYYYLNVYLSLFFSPKRLHRHKFFPFFPFFWFTLIWSNQSNIPVTPVPLQPKGLSHYDERNVCSTPKTLRRDGHALHIEPAVAGEKWSLPKIRLDRVISSKKSKSLKIVELVLFPGSLPIPKPLIYSFLET